MSNKEAAARIKINKLLEAAGWRFFPEGSVPANIRLEPSVTIKSSDLDDLGENFEKTSKGFIDFLLLDTKEFPLIVLEAKSEDKNPLVGKEQARKYAKSQNCRFVILTNGNLHYFWDLERGNPYLVTSFPTPNSVIGYQQVTPSPQRLIEDKIGEDYIVLTQRPNYQSEAAWRNEVERPGYILTNKLRFLRPYQLKAIYALQCAVKDGKDRFLFEMATGTGKTLTAAAVIKLFLRSGNARRVLFLVDRLELEDQAKKAFVSLLSADFQTVVYKENRDDWRRAEIVVTTVQSLLINNKYQQLFSPTDFDLVISDEAHRSIGGNARAVFDYFIGYKLGLTATPRDYLKRFKETSPTTHDPREAERRLLLDTYRTFGCENSQPTYRYSLLDGVKDGYLVNPTVVDARTEITTDLLSEEGFVVSFADDTGEDQQEAFKQREFEKRFFADATSGNDPGSQFARTILAHAAKLVKLANRKNNRGGNIGRVIAGNVPAGKTSYGYKYEAKYEDLGHGRRKLVKADWVIDRKTPEGKLEWGSEAWAVTQIFHWIGYEGRTLYWVAMKLNELGIKPRHAKEWSPALIGFIIRNPCYFGKHFYNRACYVSNPRKPLGDITGAVKRTIRQEKPEGERVAFDVPTVVTEDLWKLANNNLIERGRGRGKNGKSIDALLRSRVYCPQCNRPLTLYRDSKFEHLTYYRCPSYFQGWKKERCHIRSFRVNWLDNLVWDCVYSLMKQPSLVDKYMSSGKNGTRASGLKKRIASLKQQVDQLEFKIRRVHEGYEANPLIYTAKEVDERIKAFRTLISQAEKEKRRLENILEQQVVGQNTIEIVRQSLEDIRTENLDNASFSDKQELIARLGIVVYPSEDHKTVRISSKLPVLGDKLLRYKISIASPKL